MRGAVRVDRHGRLMPSKELLLSELLDREWRALRRRRDVVATVRAWGVTSQPFADLDDLLGLAGFRGPGTAEHNEVLLGLVALAKHDDLAGRIVLQRIMPGLLAVVRRRARLQRHGAFEELIGAAWMAIRCCPVERRPTQVAANLVRDAAYRAFTAPTRRRSATEISVDPRVLDETPAPTTSARSRSSPPSSPRPPRGIASTRPRPRPRPRPGRLTQRARRPAQGHAAHDPQPPRPRHRPAAPRARSPPDSGNSGRRFSRKAAMPSWASGVVAAAAITSTAYS